MAKSDNSSESTSQASNRALERKNDTAPDRTIQIERVRLSDRHVSSVTVALRSGKFVRTSD